ncbi:MAG: amidohydrolase [Clostridia bacterium]|nr:amidohydrolase [Clostridia bacterium]
MKLINAKIHMMDDDDNVIENGYIIVSEGKIKETGKMNSITELSDDMIDIKGMDVYPGFIDAHTHLGIFGDSVDFEGADGNEDTDPITPQLRVIDGINPLDGYFREAVRGGVTSVLISPGSTNPIAGQIAAVKTYGKRIDQMTIKEPAAIKFALGENPKASYNDKGQSPVTRMAIASLIRETLTKAKKYYSDKMLSLQDSSKYDMPEYDTKYEALIPLFKKEIPAHFHAHRADDIFTALRLSKEFDLNTVIVHATDGHLIYEELKEECIGILSGPILTDRSKPELKNLTPASPGILSKNGIPTAIITDHPETPIQYLPLCAAVAVREGMDESAALKAITINAAKICGIDDRVGSIEKGKDADLVIFAGDPLNVKNKPAAVIINGKMIYDFCNYT